MIRTAVDLRPNDGYIVDSLGWAYYRLGRYDDAVEQLERAVELRPDDSVINDHLGDAYWRDGRKLEATFQWNHARDLNPEPDDPRQDRQEAARRHDCRCRPRRLIEPPRRRITTLAGTAKPARAKINLALARARPEARRLSPDRQRRRLHRACRHADGAAARRAVDHARRRRRVRRGARRHHASRGQSGLRARRKSLSARFPERSIGRRAPQAHQAAAGRRRSRRRIGRRRGRRFASSTGSGGSASTMASSPTWVSCSGPTSRLASSPSRSRVQGIGEKSDA